MIKEKMPSGLRKILGRIYRYAYRMYVWGNVVIRIRAGEKSVSTLYRAVLRSPWTALFDLDHWQFPMVDEDCTVVAKGVGTFHIRARTDDLYHALPMQEPGVEKVVRSILNPGSVFVDAGANIGFYSILASRLVGSNGQVISIEMMPDTAAILRANIESNKAKNIHVVQAALSDVAGQVVTVKFPPGKLGQARIENQVSEDGMAIKTTMLENILVGVPRVNLMKLDVEGYELPALQGAGKALHKIDAIIFESLGPETDASSFLRSQGYKVISIDRRNKLAYRDKV